MRFGYVYYIWGEGSHARKKKRNRVETPTGERVGTFNLSLTGVSADSGALSFCVCLEKQNRTDMGESGHLLREAANGEPNGR